MFAKISRQAHERDRHARAVDKRLTYFQAAVGAAIVDEHDFVSAINRKFLDCSHKLGNAARPVVDWDYDREREARRRCTGSRPFRLKHQRRLFWWLSQEPSRQTEISVRAVRERSQCP